MKYLIITNNPRVRDDFESTLYIEGGFEDVLIKVRDMVHQGYELISHPIGASIRMLFSPYRSVILGEKNEKINDYHVETIESSIINFKNVNKERKLDIKNADDYALIDVELLKASLKSFEEIYNNQVKIFGGDPFETRA